MWPWWLSRTHSGERYPSRWWRLSLAQRWGGRGAIIAQKHFLLTHFLLIHFLFMERYNSLEEIVKTQPTRLSPRLTLTPLFFIANASSALQTLVNQWVLTYLRAHALSQSAATNGSAECFISLLPRNSNSELLYKYISRGTSMSGTSGVRCCVWSIGGEVSILPLLKGVGPPSRRRFDQKKHLE